MSCINKSLKEYRYLAYKFGDVAAEAIVRGYSKGEEFTIPTVKEALKFIQTNKDKQVANVLGLIESNDFTTDTIVRNLKGILNRFSNGIFITKGNFNGGSLAIKEEQARIFYQENLNKVKFLAETYPQIFEIIDTKSPDTKLVRINDSVTIDTFDYSNMDIVPDALVYDTSEPQVIEEPLLEVIENKEIELTDEQKEYLTNFEDKYPLFKDLTLPERITFLQLGEQGNIEINCSL